MASSRLVVKGLPKYVDSANLRAHFAAFADVTDAKVISKNGESRRFGFVGFKTAKDANRARKHFDKTFVDTCKVSVEIAKPVGDSNIPRPWSKYSKGSSAYQRQNPSDSQDDPSRKPKTAREAKKLENERKLKAKAAHETHVNDKRWKEFAEVAAPRNQKTLWSNDTGVKVAETVPNRKPGGQGLSVQRTRIKFAQDDEEEDEEGEEEEGEDEAGETDDEQYDDVKQKQQSMDDPAMDDMEYLKSKMTDDFSDEEEEAKEVNGEEELSEEEEEELEEEEEKPVVKKKKAKREKGLLSDDEVSGEEEGASGDDKEGVTRKGDNEEEEEEELGEAGRLFIRNLSYEATEEQIGELCEKHGPVAEVHIPVDRTSKKPKGFAYVLYMMPAHAVVAQRELDGTIFQGRLIHAIPARSKPTSKKTDFGDQSSSFKAAKEQERRANAGSDHNWNSLFLNQDAVVASMQESYGLEKSDILNPESSNMAVRVALGETHAIATTKAFLEEHGVNISAFTADGAKLQPRSKTIILVKNLPADSTEDDLRQLFSKYGALDRLVLAPNRVLALTEFLVPSEARSAFSSLAYSRFKHIPLYLEWAPKKSFKSQSKAKKPQKEAVVEVEADADGSEDDSCTLYVTNLSFDTTEESLLAAVKKKTKAVRAVTVATKANPKGGAVLSRGFGFLEFANKQDAGTALLSMQGMDVDGHRIKLKMSTRTSVKESGAEKKAKKAQQPAGRKSGTKVIVRNVPFEANKKEIQQLFHTFGQVKTVRMPRKFDGSHRGFAFVEFLSKEEAKNAVEALAGTHLYGRHLVIEFAELDESIELIRDKAKRDLDSMHKHEGKPSKKQKLVVEGQNNSD